MCKHACDCLHVSEHTWRSGVVSLLLPCALSSWQTSWLFPDLILCSQLLTSEVVRIYAGIALSISSEYGSESPLFHGKSVCSFLSITGLFTCLCRRCFHSRMQNPLCSCGLRSNLSWDVKHFGFRQSIFLGHHLDTGLLVLIFPPKMLFLSCEYQEPTS